MSGAEVSTPALSQVLARILAGSESADALVTHFQPIVDLRKNRILGYEALTRGPADTPLQDPVVLFSVARAANLMVPLERLLVRLIVRRFRAAGLPGQLFVKISAATLADAATNLPQICAEMLRMDLPPTRLVIEVTSPGFDAELVDVMRTVRALRQLGVVIALDDGDEHFPGLMRWAEFRPDFIKLNPRIAMGISRDSTRMDFVRSLSILARQLGTTLIAGGLEDKDDLRAVQRIGVPVCQGYLFARPSLLPRKSLDAVAQELLQSVVDKSEGSGWRHYGGLAIKAGDLARRGSVVDPGLSCRDVVAIFQQDPDLYALVVLSEDEHPIGMLRRLDVLSRASARFFTELNGNRRCSLLMDRSPVLFDVGMPLDEMSNVVAGMREAHLIDGFVVVEDGRYFGTGRFGDLLKAVNDLQLAYARHANPLTLLPGNAVIDNQVERILADQVPFLVAYFDLDHFKPFNDVYGYQKGDEVIRLCARLIQAALDPAADFLGHVGGDDFIAVMTSPDWEERIGRLLADFDAAVRLFFLPEHVAAGGYAATDRTGKPVFHELTCLSVGIVSVSPGDYSLHAEVARKASEAKKQAKKSSGSSYFVERRRPAQAHLDIDGLG